MNAISKILSITLLSCSTATLAHGHFYGAFDAGIFTANFQNQFTDLTDTTPLNLSEQSVQNGYTIGGALGYRGRIHKHLYFYGAELAGNADMNTAVYQPGSMGNVFSDSVKIAHHVDLTFDPGVKLSHSVLAILKLGVSLAKIQDIVISPLGTILPPTPTLTYSSSSNVWGFAGGLELLKKINCHLGVFTQADYHDYGKDNFFNFLNYTATYSHSSHVYSYDVLLGLSYNFK